MAIDIDKPLISFVIPCYNEAEVFPLLQKELVSLAGRLSPKYNFEIILIDDGSRDNTWDQIVSFASEDARVRAVSLSRNFGHQMALTCGYDLARGEAVISMDADLQDPPEVIPDLIKEWEKGTDIVYAVRTEREGESAFKLWTATFFYRLFRILGNAPASIDAGDFRLMSKKSLEAFRKLRERHRYIRGMVGWVGFRTSKVHYVRRARPKGLTKYPFMKMLSFAMDAIISFSSFPLRLAYIFSAIGSLVVFIFLIRAFIRYIFYGTPLVPGWTSLILSIFIFGFLTLLSLGLIGEYIGRIYDQMKNRPLYLIRELIEKESNR